MLILLLLIVVGGTLGFYISQQSKNPQEIKITIGAKRIDIPKIGVPNVKFNMLKMNAKAITITNENLAKSGTPIQPKISIVHQVKGKTTINGMYWIVTIRNDSDQIVIRPKELVRE
ncbi:MAG: hypothetical protein L3J83_01405 [Proteobacteria bacterium]|nr:hypothetical protein [Pseudomonadota bacterium]